MYPLGEQFILDYKKAKSDPKVCVTGAKYRISVLSERVVRIEYNPNGIFVDNPTELVVNRNLGVAPFTLRHVNNILEIDTKGALNVKKIMPEAHLIFIAPPSIEELEARLRGRHTETEEAIQKRLASIKSEMENSKHYDFIVVNDTVENAVKQIEKITDK